LCSGVSGRLKKRQGGFTHCTCGNYRDGIFRLKDLFSTAYLKFIFFGSGNQNSVFGLRELQKLNAENIFFLKQTKLAM
jgi:hypothetical protein